VVRCRVCAPSLVVLKWASACIPVLLQCVTGEGSACVIPQDVVSSNFHVGFWSWTSSYRKTAEKLSEHSEVVATPVVYALFSRGAEQLTQAWSAVQPELVLQCRALLWATCFLNFFPSLMFSTLARPGSPLCECWAKQLLSCFTAAPILAWSLPPCSRSRLACFPLLLALSRTSRQ